jgi:hypothetical protein
VRRAVSETGVEAEVNKVSDLKDMRAGIMSTPAVSIDGTIKVTGRVPKIDEVKSWISWRLKKGKTMKTRSKLALVALLILAGTPIGMAATKPKNETNETVKAEQKLAIPRLLDLGADRCIPCKMMRSSPSLANWA